MSENIYTILIGGRAGEGIKKAAQVIAGLLCQAGKQVYQADDYQSLIRGGHNFSTVSSSDETVYAAYQDADLIICFDHRSVEEHAGFLKPGGVLFCNSDESDLEDGAGIPMTSIMKKHYPEGSNIGIVAIAIFCAHHSIHQYIMRNTIKQQFKRNIAENIAFADEIYELVIKKSSEPMDHPFDHQYRFLSGNQAIGLGAYYAGLDFYFAYPMTPASSLLHYLALKKESLGIYAIHAESELAAINMAIGSAVAGCRSAVGSSGGGFALMQEAFSMAGIVEAPLLCVLTSRPGPATGVSTYTAQEDLWFAINQGHGEFPRVVASPDCHERAFSLAAELLSLAWEVQTPAILLTEKQLSEDMRNLHLDQTSLPEASCLMDNCSKDYKRYAITESGISPLQFPQDCPESVVKWNSHEHFETGLRTDAAGAMIAMKDKRNRKNAVLEKATRKYQRVAVYGNGENVIFAYGSTVMELREALKYTDSGFRIVAPIYLEPFPFEELKEYEGKAAIVVEHSSTGQFARFLQWKLKLQTKRNILKYDGRAFDPIKLANLLEEAIHA
ncbi:MAG: 2-oxoacid:acceptor oxidoreductase family protein [Candidatus Cloacimonadaceae bacterium]|nr:2-oxoacid:acceptor oxidoreductase family protein [Candidatus Cloacimonadaceae bacterium]MDP3114266.1 2-oxoacid:acceptor oxidoreductase family protein [Candidatus Cloacimonadaceae bacterium]